MSTDESQPGTFQYFGNFGFGVLHPIKLVVERPCSLPIASKRFEPQRYEGHKEIRIALFFVPLAAEASPLETDKSTKGDWVRQVSAPFPVLPAALVDSVCGNGGRRVATCQPSEMHPTSRGAISINSVKPDEFNTIVQGFLAQHGRR